jgi:hypothetical protein
MVAKLNAETLKKGRECLRYGDLPGFERWWQQHVPTIDWDKYGKTFRLLLEVDERPRALKLFNDIFIKYDPVEDGVAGRMLVVGMVLAAVGAAAIIAGLIWLVGWLVG